MGKEVEGEVSRGVSGSGIMVEDGLRSFSIIMRFREKESVCMSRVSMTCSGWERVWFRLECFFRRQKRAARRRRQTNARAPKAMPILAPVEREDLLLTTEAVVVGIAVGLEEEDAVTLNIDVLSVVELGLDPNDGTAVGSLVTVAVVCNSSIASVEVAVTVMLLLEFGSVPANMLEDMLVCFGSCEGGPAILKTLL